MAENKRIDQQRTLNERHEKGLPDIRGGHERGVPCIPFGSIIRDGDTTTSNQSGQSGQTNQGSKEK